MANKPFKPPFAKKPPSDSQPTLPNPLASTKRIVTPRSSWEELIGDHGPLPPPTIFESDAATDAEDAGQPEGYFMVLWRAFSLKKKPKWDSDGVLSISAGQIHLQDLDGRTLAKTNYNEEDLPGIDEQFGIRGKTVQIESAISKQDFLSGKPFLQPSVQENTAASTKSASIANTFVRPNEVDEAEPEYDDKCSHNTGSGKRKRSRELREEGSMKKAKLSRKEQKRQDKLDQLQSKSTVYAPAPAPAPLPVKGKRPQFKTPLLSNNVLPRPTGPIDIPQPRHDPTDPNALVMKRPQIAPRGKRIVDVVVDPILTERLRKHQREGVAFLYECVMGLRGPGEGAILADEMGLGKTLQTIALIWTLLKQNPIYEDAPVVKRALVVCPATLVKNWRKEFFKWLGKERIGVFVADDDAKKMRLTDFTKGRAYQVMIIGYEKLRNVEKEIELSKVVDIVIMDEGHRLKTETNLSAAAVKSMNTEKRVILTGTPMQNNLSEYFTMIDLVNPGLLGKASKFKGKFEQPILRSQEPNAPSNVVEQGQARAQELREVSDQFIIRRTADVIAGYLPRKTEYVVFCKPTTTQAQRYRDILSSKELLPMLENQESLLQLIGILRLLCNSEGHISPSWKLSEIGKAMRTEDGLVDPSVPFIPSALPSLSTKLRVMDALLKGIRTLSPKEKVVIVSNYTSTLDFIESRVSSEYGYLRLDGKTPASKRQHLVDEFNSTSADRCFAFLLSAKAGGVGLNLIGASRLIMFDIDWNPATDLQAMSRIHRDGQKRECFIYRLLVMGAIDEKIFQRQISKRSLAASVVGHCKSGASVFTKDELRDLFTFDESGVCKTHELVCHCSGDGRETFYPLSNEESIGLPDMMSEDELPEVGAFITANKIDIEEQERRVREGQVGKKKKSEMLSENPGYIPYGELLEYRHVDVASFYDDKIEDDYVPVHGLDSVVEDEVLRHCLDKERTEHPRIMFLFAKRKERP